MRVFLFVLLFVSLSANATIDRTYSGVQEYLIELNQKYPKTTEIFTLTTSDMGDPIQGIRIGTGSVSHLVVGTHHGNEYGSTEVALAFATSVAEQPIKNQTLYVIPVLNVTGYNSRNRYEKSASGYHDANRDYPGPCGTSGPFSLKSTQALANFVATNKIVGSATLHTYTGAVLYPWGISTVDVKTEYDDFFIDLTKIATTFSGYLFGNSTDLLYPADGTFEDWAFWQHGVWSILFELGYSHSPSDAEIDQMIAGNVPGLRAMFERMPSERAEKHEFTGKCDAFRRGRLDLRND